MSERIHRIKMEMEQFMTNCKTNRQAATKILHGLLSKEMLKNVVWGADK